MNSWVLLKEAYNIPAGTIVYTYTGYGYGIARDDTIYSDKLHISISEELEKTPFFSIPFENLKSLHKQYKQGVLVRHTGDPLDIFDWLNVNIRGRWIENTFHCGFYYLEFEKEEDAVLFKLRWQ
jgi:hypothetical protein